MNKPLNILYIAHVPTMLGANRSLLNLLSGLNVAVKATVILPEKGPFSDELDKLNIPYHVIAFKHVCVQKYSFLKKTLLYLPRLLRIRAINIKAISTIKKNVNLIDFDLIHSNSGIISIGQMLSKQTGIPHVWHLREFQDLDYNLEYIYGKDKYLLLLKRAAAVISISKSIAKHFYIGEDINVIYNGLFNKEQIHNKSADPNDRYFIFCGALIYDKGIEDAIYAFSKITNEFPSIKLKIAGEFVKEEYRNKVLNIVSTLGISASVQFLGFQNDLTQLMQNSIALFMCSHNEALGRVTLEAMYNKCLVIGYNNAGTSELISNKINGLLYNDNREFESSIRYSISDPSACMKLENEGYKFVISNFTEKAYADQVLNVYKSLIYDRG